MNIAIGSGSLRKPQMIIGGIKGVPSSVRLAGVALIADADYFASLRADTDELWIALARDLSGTTNAPAIAP